MGTLMVYLDKATDLANTDVIGKSDPYVKFHLEQDNWMFDKTFGKVKSTTQKDVLNPVWGETYAFDIPNLEKMKLHIEIKDDDPVIDDKLGACTIDLMEIGLTSEAKEIERVIDGNTFNKGAKIYLKIWYRE